MANIVTTEVITEALNGRSVLLSDKLSSDYTTMTEDQILNGTGVASMVSDIKKNRAFGDGATATTTGGAIGDGASATSGGAIGDGATASTGFAGGDGATAQIGAAMGCRASSANGGAIGYQAIATAGGAVGTVSQTYGGAAVGSQTYSVGGGALGNQAYTINGCAVGNESQGLNVAIGNLAKCLSGNNKIDAIQIGTGTNSTLKSMQVYGTTLLTPVDASVNSPTMLIPLSLITASYNAASAADQAAFKQALGIS